MHVLLVIMTYDKTRHPILPENRINKEKRKEKWMNKDISYFSA